MKKRVLFIHGGGEGAYEEDGKIVESLRHALGDGYEVRYPSMPGEAAPVYVNYRNADELREAGYSPDIRGEIPGYSVFLRDGERVLHTYSTFGRGVEAIASSTQFLDWTPLGRQDGFL